MRKPAKFSSPEWGSAQSPDHKQGAADGFDAGAAPEGLFDADDISEEDLWFLPDPSLDAVDPLGGDPIAAMPGPKADQTPLVDVASWAAAQGVLAAPLADLALLQGRLMTRLAQGPAGWQFRLALQDAVDLSWLAGDRVPMERLALWMALRLTGDADDSQELVRAGWAVRRLTEGPGPAADLAVFLGRHDPGDQEQLTHKVADWQEVMAAAHQLHPLTRAALSFHIWSVLGLSDGHRLGGAAPLPLMEAAVVAARLSAATGFLPLALGGAGGLRAGGSPADRLQRWIAGADHATRAALRMLDQVDSWEARATETCADLSGRTPPQLINLLRDWPLISAPMAQQQTGASRAAIQRNLGWMTDKGLIREITGQGRYRFWRAAV